VKTGSDPVSMDPLGSPSIQAIEAGAYVYSRLVKYAVGTRDKPPTGAIEGDAASSWEISGDGLQATFKLRQGMKFDPRPPTNGKVLSIEDVKFSWEKFAAVSTSRANLVNAVEPSAPVTSVSYPDASTFVMKLAFPYAPLLRAVAYAWNNVIMPLESADKFDPRNTMRGSGPWMLAEYEPSVQLKHLRNPNYYQPDKPFLDGIDSIVLPEYAAGLAQFQAGRLWTFGVRQEDILRIKRESPQLVLTQENWIGPNNSWCYSVSDLPGSPFKDKRLRQAISMSTDRDAMIEIAHAPSVFEREGFPVTTRWHNIIGAGYSEFWLDPQDAKQIGEGAKFYQHNPAEARKLLAAAGYDPSTSPLTTTYTYPADNNSLRESALAQMLRDGGINASDNVIDYGSEFVPKYLSSHAQAPGIWQGRDAGQPDVDLHLSTKLLPQGRNSFVGNPIGGGAHELISAARIEQDNNKRVEMLKQLQKILAVELPAIPYSGDMLGFSLKWPQLRNANYYYSYMGGTGGGWSEDALYWWFDKTKQPA
jgi:peptide/nickel transport system substrate-binding protein